MSPPGEHDRDDRSAVARAYAMASQVSAVAMEMVIPALVGLGLDRWLGTVMVFLILGGALGMTVGMIHLVRLASAGKFTAAGRSESREDEPPGQRRQ